MSKKNANQEVTELQDAKTMETETMKTKEFVKLETIMKENPTLSLRKICLEVGATYNVMLKASKAPIIGQVYDPEAFNYELVEKKLLEKIGIEKYNEIDWPSLAESSKRVPSVKIPIVVGNLVTLRNDESVYNVLFTTDTHIVFIATNSTQPRVMSNETFLHQGGKVVEA